MKRIRWAMIAFFSIGALLVSASAEAGGKPDGARCHVHKSCRSKLCLRENPLDKFGACCGGQDCAALGAQCGEIDNGCGTPLQCGGCDPGSSCVNNQCVSGSTTTTTTSSTTTTTNAGGCQHKTCGDPNPPAQCHPTGGGGLGCYEFETAEDICGTCVEEIICDAVQGCTASSDCAPGSFCVVNTCCGTGKCAVPCAPPTTTTTSTTSTTIPPTTTVPPPTTTTAPPTTSTTTVPPSTTTTLGGFQCPLGGNASACNNFGGTPSCSNCCAQDSGCNLACGLASAGSCANSTLNTDCANNVNAAGCALDCCD